jgi:hypothetical protein
MANGDHGLASRVCMGDVPVLDRSPPHIRFTGLDIIKRHNAIVGSAA